MDFAMERCNERFAEDRSGRLQKRFLRVPLVHYAIDGEPAVLDSLGIKGSGVSTFRFAAFVPTAPEDRFQVHRAHVDKLVISPKGIVDPGFLLSLGSSEVAQALLADPEVATFVSKHANTLMLDRPRTPWRDGPDGHDVLSLHLSEFIQAYGRLVEVADRFEQLVRATRAHCATRGASAEPTTP